MIIDKRDCYILIISTYCNINRGIIKDITFNIIINIITLLIFKKNGYKPDRCKNKNAGKMCIRDRVSPYIEKNIFRSVENVNLDTVIAYKQYGVKHNFLERYDEMGRLNGASGSQTADNKEME